MPSSLSAVSLCICTYNRAEHLEQTLESILVNKVSLIDGDEILIINNNSNDETEDIIDQFSLSLPINSVFEAQQGLSNARNTAIRNFKNSTLIFIDDDVSIADGFFEAYRAALKKYPETEFFGGKIFVDWQGGRPVWLQSDNLPLVSGLIVHYDQEEKALIYSSDTLLPYGANFALRRSLIEKVGQFNVTLGVNGKALGRGEETDYMQRAIELGATGRYVKNALVWHRFHQQRLTTKHMFAYGIQKGLVFDIKGEQKKSGSLFKALFFMLKGCMQLMKNRRDRYCQCVINAGMQVGSSPVRWFRLND